MNPSLINRITIEPGKCGGRPCIRGMRIRVADILGLLGSGASHQEVLEDYPTLDESDILATLEYAAAQADHSISGCMGSHCSRGLRRDACITSASFG